MTLFSSAESAGGNVCVGLCGSAAIHTVQSVSKHFSFSLLSFRTLSPSNLLTILHSYILTFLSSYLLYPPTSDLCSLLLTPYSLSHLPTFSPSIFGTSHPAGIILFIQSSLSLTCPLSHLPTFPPAHPFTRSLSLCPCLIFSSPLFLSTDLQPPTSDLSLQLPCLSFFF